MNESKWHYSINNKDRLTASEEDLIQMINEGIVSESTLVWKEGLEGWIPISESNLSTYLQNVTPPPLPNHKPEPEPEPEPEPTKNKSDDTKLNNTYFWLIAFSPVVCTIIYIIVVSIWPASNTESTIFIITFLTLILLMVLDIKQISSAKKLAPPYYFFVFIIPFWILVHLWQRATVAGYSKVGKVLAPTTYLICIVGIITISDQSAKNIYTDYSINEYQNKDIRDNFNPVGNIRLVKEGSFNSYPNKPIGETLSNRFDKINWKSFVSSENEMIVEANGTTENMDVQIQFIVNTDSTFEVSYVAINSQSLNEYQLIEFIDSQFSSVNDLKLVNYKLEKAAFGMQVVNGVVKNLSQLDIESIQISFLIYDSNNQIIEETTDFIQKLPANGEWKVAAPVLATNGVPAKAELIAIEIY